LNFFIERIGCHRFGPAGNCAPCQHATTQMVLPSRR
jgi:hypothetical protein